MGHVDETELGTCFLEGMYRIATAIDGIADFDPIIGHKIPAELRVRIDQQESLEAALAVAAEYTIASLRTAKAVIYIFPDVDVLLFGKTKNNLREFNFVLPIIDEGWTLVIANAADSPAKKEASFATYFGQFAALLEPYVNGFYRDRASVNAGLVFQLSQYVVNFVRYYLSQSFSVKKPGLAIVANDHSPTAVAFAQSMRFFKVPRLYVQHAEVSATFPPLNFEFSVLRNGLSKRIYEDIGPATGEIFVISRFSEPFISPQVQVERAGPQNVVVYTTGRVEPAGLSLLCDKLETNPHVASTVVKAHPNQGLVEWPDGARVTYEPISHPHIAIVGNSSVAIELLHRGVPVFQNFSFDPVEADYYGFVRIGTAPVVSLEELAGRFWAGARFDDNWYEKFADAFAPPRDSSLADAQRLRAAISALKRSWPLRQTTYIQDQARDTPATAAIVLPARFKKRLLSFAPSYAARGLRQLYWRTPLQNLISFRTAEAGRPESFASRGGNSSKNVVEWVQFSLSSSKHPAEWLSRSLALRIFTTEHAVRAVEGMHRERHAAVYDLFDHLHALNEAGATHVWLALKRFEISGVELPTPMSEIVRISLQEPEGYVRASLEGLAFNSCMRLNDLANLEALLERGRYVRRESLSTTRRVALLRHYGKLGQRDTYGRLKEEFWRAETPLHRLKIEDLDQGTSLQGRSNTHQEVEQKYAAVVNPTVLSEYKRYVDPTYTHLRSQMRFMDVRSNRSEREDFYQLVLRALNRREPLSMIRLGDGEAYALSGRQPIFTDGDRQNRERHWWGTELSPERREEISLRVREAIKRADVLGIPSIHRFVRDTLDKSRGFSENIQGRGLIQVLSYLAETEERPLIGDDRMNLALFRSSEAMRPLLSAAERCIVVSSAAADALPQWMEQATELIRVEIPTHQRTSRNQKYASSSAPLPYVYQEVDERVRELVSGGTLVLVAGGIIGKIFIGTAKSAGGVALDLGSVMDEWVGAGIHSLN